MTADGDGSGLLIETDVGQQPTAGRPPIGMPGADGEVKRSLLVREHWPVMLVLAAFVVAGLVYSLVLPLGEVSDETSHFALVRFIAEQGRAPLSNQERQAIGIKGDASPFYHGLVALLSQHVDVSSLPTLPGALDRQERLVPSDGKDYFRVFFHTENEFPPYRGIVLAWHLARLVSVPLGLATILAVYATALAVFPDRRRLALVASVLVAFVPRFVTQSAVLNDDNLSTPLVAFSVFCLVRVVQGDYGPRRLAVLGVLVALASLAKYHALVLLAEVTLVLAVLAWRQVWPFRKWLARFLWVLVPFFLVSGWWFAFLVVRFNRVAELGLVEGLMATMGDPVMAQGLQSAANLEALGTAGNVEGVLSFPAWVWMVFRTYWIVYGFRGVVLAPSGVYVALAVLALLGCAGLAHFVWTGFAPRSAVRTADPPVGPGGAAAFPWAALAVLALHLGVYLFVSISRHIFEPDQTTAQGRHLYPAVISIAIFSALGLASSWQWILRRWRRTGSDGVLAAGLGSVLLALTVITPPAFLLPAFLPYMPLRSAHLDDTRIAHPLHANLGPGMDLVGYDDAGASVTAGQSLPVTLYWRTSTKPEAEFLVEVCLSDSRGKTVTCHRGVPADGLYPMSAWENGYVLRDRRFLPVPSCLESGSYGLSASLLPVKTNSATTTIEGREKQRIPVPLGPVEVRASGTAARVGELWLGPRLLRGGPVTIHQLRQSLTLLSYYATSAEAASAGETSRLEFQPSPGETPDNESEASASWLPLHGDGSTAVLFTCSDGTTVRTDHFLVDPSLEPGRYTPSWVSPQQPTPFLLVATRDRQFEASPSAPNRIDANFAGQLLLEAYGVDLRARKPGDSIPVMADWKSLTQQKYGLIEALYLLRSNDMSIEARSEWALGGHYPNLLWAPGESVAEERLLSTTPATPPGLYQIELSLYGFMTFEDGSTSAPIYVPIYWGEEKPSAEKLTLGTVRILDPLDGTPPATQLTASLGQTIELTGLSLLTTRARPGQTVSVVLYWTTSEPPAADYTVFTQLVGPDGQVWAQQDSQPQGGRYPTSLWGDGDMVLDRYTLSLPATAPPGDYQLLAGMYDLESGARLVAASDGTPWPDNAIQLATVHVD